MLSLIFCVGQGKTPSFFMQNNVIVSGKQTFAFHMKEEFHMHQIHSTWALRYIAVTRPLSSTV